jgi:hypothetical protein
VILGGYILAPTVAVIGTELIAFTRNPVLYYTANPTACIGAVDVAAGTAAGVPVTGVPVPHAVPNVGSVAAKDVNVIDYVFVDTRKFSDYVFTSNSSGKDVVFRSLDYTGEDSATLAKIWQTQAAEKFSKGEYTLGKVDQYGQRINIEIELPGKGEAAGKTSYLKSGWMMQPNREIKLNTPFSGFTRSPK